MYYWKGTGGRPELDSTRNHATAGIVALQSKQYEVAMRHLERGHLLQGPVGLAAVHALRGDKEAAYDWLQQAIDAGFFAYAELERHPCFESLHGEERFQGMMAGVEARVEEARRQVEASKAVEGPPSAEAIGPWNSVRTLLAGLVRSIKRSCQPRSCQFKICSLSGTNDSASRT
jgi:hypothetical protein